MGWSLPPGRHSLLALQVAQRYRRIDHGSARAHTPGPQRVAAAALPSIVMAFAGCSIMRAEGHDAASFKDGLGGDREPCQFDRLTVNGKSPLANTPYRKGYLN